jgi:hypothetical protein
VWTPHGPKLVASGATGNANQGQSVALSADGRTAAVSGYQDDDGRGAVWIFTALNNRVATVFDSIPSAAR